jgi:flagellar basal-body rod modification protein FlgD
MTEIASAAAAAAFTPQDRRETDAPETVSESTNGLTADFETFLRLLTTQMRNQDPLQPMESTEFVSQLAQFSAVEQQVKTNQQLGDILEQISGGDPARLADWLGRDVRAAAPTQVEGGPTTTYPVAPELTPSAATLVVRDAAGGVVAETPFDPGAENVVWDGRLADGSAAPAGLYSFEARFIDASGATETTPAETYARIVEARRSEDGITLVREGGAEIDADAISGVRQPPPSA